MVFALSGIISAVNFYLLQCYPRRGLCGLKQGAAEIGAGRLDHAIASHTRDKLGDLAGTFNEMAKSRSAARGQLTPANSELESRNQIDAQRHVSERLLRNIVPAQIADELRQNEAVEPKYFEDVTILFTGFVGFTLSTEKLAAEDLVYRLDHYLVEIADPAHLLALPRNHVPAEPVDSASVEPVRTGQG